MENLINRMLRIVSTKHPNEMISFCGFATSWEQCITEWNGNKLFWYNINGFTHAEPIKG